MDEEYKILRDEMNLYYQNITNYNIALFTAASVIFTYALSQEDFFYCLLPLLVILPLYILCENEHKKACKLGAYLNVFCEGANFNWERRHHFFDISKAKGKRNNKDLWPYTGLSCVSCIFSALKVYANPDLNKWNLLIPAVCLCMSFIVIKKTRVNYVKTRSMYLQGWEDVKRNFKN